MLRLLTLGGLAIVDEAEGNPGLAGAQRRTLALLSVLAVAGPVGLSRDKLVALFWPEADADRGRHALTQALYASRRGLRCDDLFLVTGDVRLNPERITSDVGDLEISLSDDPERIPELYRGPFLDGFFLSGSGEFEQWTAAQRTRIEERVARAYERLAISAEEGRDPKVSSGSARSTPASPSGSWSRSPSPATEQEPFNTPRSMRHFFVMSSISRPIAR